MLYYIVVLISLGFWWLALHEFKKFQIFVIFALFKNQGCYTMADGPIARRLETFQKSGMLHNGRWTHSSQARNSPHLLMSLTEIWLGVLHLDPHAPLLVGPVYCA